jgi:hypothetical protein
MIQTPPQSLLESEILSLFPLYVETHSGFSKGRGSLECLKLQSFAFQTPSHFKVLALRDRLSRGEALSGIAQQPVKSCAQ